MAGVPSCQRNASCIIPPCVCSVVLPWTAGACLQLFGTEVSCHRQDVSQHKKHGSVFNGYLSNLFFHPSRLLIAASRCIEKCWLKIQNYKFPVCRSSLKENNNLAVSPADFFASCSEWTLISQMGYPSRELCFIGSSLWYTGAESACLALKTPTWKFSEKSLKVCLAGGLVSRSTNSNFALAEFLEIYIH